MGRQLKTVYFRHRHRIEKPVELAKSAFGAMAERRLARTHPELEIVTYSAAQLDRDDDASWHSQHGQDRYLCERFGLDTRQGVFLDIGCNHPIENNNSARFEALGWQGYAFDPQSRFCDAWATLRTTPFISAAISVETSNREFVEFAAVQGWEHQLSGFAEYVDPAHLDAYPHERRTVSTGPLRRFVADLDRVDLVLVDVEGAEMEVLDGIDLEHLKPSWLVVENNRGFGGDEVLRARILSAGYRFVARVGHTDDVFERRDA